MGMAALLGTLALATLSCSSSDSTTAAPPPGGGSSNLIASSSSPVDGDGTMTPTCTIQVNSGGSEFDELDLSQTLGSTGHEVVVTWNTPTHVVNSVQHIWGPAGGASAAPAASAKARAANIAVSLALEWLMDFDASVKLAVYRHFAETGRRPSPQDVASRAGSDVTSVLGAYQRLRGQRVLVLEADGASIRMAPPFSGVPTQHVVTVGTIRYFANCAWDVLGVPAALHRPGVVTSRCAQSGEALHLHVGLDGPEPCDWLFHCLVPAAKWWDDIVFT
jgi:hypothetical protein